MSKCDVFRNRQCVNQVVTIVEMRQGRAAGASWEPIPSCERCASDAVRARPRLYRIASDAREQIQRATVKRLNDLTPENNGRVQAEAVDANATLCCAHDSDHGMATVYLTIDGGLFELCPDCAVRVIDGMLRDGRVVSDSNDLIDVEVYLWCATTAA